VHRVHATYYLRKKMPCGHLRQHKIKKVDDVMERVSFIGTVMVVQVAHVQPTRAQARRLSQTALAKVMQFSTLHCTRRREGGNRFVFSYV
jgi:hypothetical protein